MNTDAIIEEIQKLPPEEVSRVGSFLDDYRSEVEADIASAKRADELQAGTVQPLSFEEVFGHPAAE
jgi:hypothetical protein